MYTCTPQPGDPAHSDKTAICPKCLKEDDQPLLKCQKCDVCYKCLGLIPCTEPKSNDHKSKYKRTRSAYPPQTNTHTKRPKPTLLPLPLSATTHTAAKVGTKAHKRKKYLEKIKRRRARAAKNTSAHKLGQILERAAQLKQPPERSHPPKRAPHFWRASRRRRNEQQPRTNARIGQPE